MEPNVAKMVENRSNLANLRHEFAIKYGFAYKRPQYFKNCIVIRWKASKGKGNLKRIKEYVKVCHDLSDKYDLWDKTDMFLEAELRLFKIGIYINFQSDYHCWAIPNDRKDIQEYVLSKLPKWAKVSKK